MPDQLIKSASLAENPEPKLASTRNTNEIRRTLNAMLGGSPNLRMPPGRFPINPPFLAVITNTGPEGTEDDYTDERYWWRRSFIDGKDSETDEDADTTTHVTTSYWDLNGEPVIGTGTNLVEGSLDKEEAGLSAYQSGTHLLPIGTRVIVFSMIDAIGNVRYFLYPQPTDREAAGEISSDAAGDEIYLGKLYTPTIPDFDPSTSADENPPGGLPAGDNCYFVNQANFAATGHSLIAGTRVEGILRPRKYVDGDGVMWFVVDLYGSAGGGTSGDLACPLP